MKDKFEELRMKYSDFIYDKYEIIDNLDNYELIYYFNIPNLEEFHHKIVIPKKIIKRNKIDKDLFNYIVFNIGMIELISYYKCVCSPNIIIKCGYLDENQFNWFRKIYYNGLSEFLYRNSINININNFVNFIIDGNFKKYSKVSFDSNGNLICVGGGKDSCVSLDLLKNEINNACFLMNAKKPMLECAKITGYDENNIFCVTRILDKDKIIKLNELGYLNGHIPISAIIAFISYLVAYLSGKKNIILSNEASANESYVKDSNINHQYSKSFEFEMDFYNYTHTYFSDDINYFSLLRPLTELQITMIFSKLKQYHSIFKSCNLGSKQDEWKWCLNCPKCLFAYIALSPFLANSYLINIFGENLLNKENLLNDFIGLIGKGENKPFECVGTYDEVNFSVNYVIHQYINKKQKLPYLLQYYYDNYGIKEIDNSILKRYNDDNNLNNYFNKIVKDVLNNG